MPEHLDLLWKIVTLLVDDLEYKNNQDDSEGSNQKYKAPISMTIKAASDKYIYTSVFMALSSVVRLSLDFDDKDDLLSRLARLSCELYYKVSDNSEFK